MGVEVRSVMARPDGFFVVNAGDIDEVAVTLDPGAKDLNSSELMGWLALNNAESWIAPPVDIAELKLAALAEVRANALAVRTMVADAVSAERAISWVLKALFASVWQINDQAPNPLLQPLADVALAGFAIETDLTGEDPVVVRDRSVEKAGSFFHALQFVEGMERMAETQIDAVGTPVALGEVISRLRILEAQALQSLSDMGVAGVAPP